MTASQDEFQQLKAAGSRRLTFNAPMGMDRAAEFVDWIGAEDSSTVVDLGCGRGSLAQMLVRRLPLTKVIGVDSDAEVIEEARALAAASDLDSRLTFVEWDAAGWTGPADAAICIGASHAFGGAAPMLQHLGELAGVSLAIVGDGVWQAEPDSWCLETFGELPGVDELMAMAADSGWSVDEVDTSTIDEWDQFERGWIAGVRSVGTVEAAEFADQRDADYQRYRGILGFGWLRLRR